jgi:hypothetical protein
MGPRLLAGAVVLAALPAAALDSPQWPPPAPVAQRMRDLQQAIIRRDSTLAEREAAREELASLLKSPAGQARGRTPGEKPSRPARAAIDPYPSVVAPVNIAPAAPPPRGVAELEVVAPPKPIVIPQAGAVAAPAGNFAIDPRTGAVLHGAPGGPYVDPRTGQVVPR